MELKENICKHSGFIETFFEDLIHLEIKPEKCLKHKTEALAVNAALKTLIEFRQALIDCEYLC